MQVFNPGTLSLTHVKCDIGLKWVKTLKRFGLLIFGPFSGFGLW